ncbi:MAG: ABC transporter permease, partial [Pararhodobacter sp.]|nr:ABC transporter permease [Pararhodobacter sp.]
LDPVADKLLILFSVVLLAHEGTTVPGARLPATVAVTAVGKDIIVIIGFFGWAPIARMTRAEFLRIRNLEYVAAARCAGLPGHRIIFQEILPNALPSVIVLIALEVGAAILIEAMISFLGFGDPGSVSWGQTLYFNYQSLRIYPIASLAPGAMIFITVMGFNLLADGLSDAANPRGTRARTLKTLA